MLGSTYQGPSSNAVDMNDISSGTPVFINAYINDKATRVLFDTGSGITLLSKQLASEMGLMPSIDSSVCRTVQSATAHMFSILGTVKVRLTVGNCTETIVVHIANTMKPDFIFGMDCIPIFYDVSIGDNKVNIKPLNKPRAKYCMAAGVTDVSEMKVKTIEEVVVKPRSSVCVYGTFADNVVLCSCVTGIIEPELQRGKSKIGVARTLVQGKSELPIILTNVYNRELKVMKGQVVGTWSPCEVVDAKDYSGAVNVSNGDSVVQDIDVGDEGICDVEVQKFKTMLRKHNSVFTSGIIGRTNVVEHEVDTGDAKPVKQRPYSVPHHLKPYMHQLLETQLKQGLIRESTSPWAAPVLLVKKKNGTYRFVVDFRRLNLVTRKSSCPIPRIDEALDAFTNARYFTALDLSNAFWQIPLREQDKCKTAFTTPFGLYEYNVLPMGMCNAPSTMQSLMYNILMGCNWKYALAYLDDIIIYSRSVESHINEVSDVLRRVSEAGLTLNIDKSSFLKTRVRYLGHIVSSSGVSPDPSNLLHVKEIRPPRNVTDVKAFLGLVGYYRRFIKGFSTIASPLNRLTEANTLFDWTSECQQSFDLLKKLVTESPILAFPNFHQPFIVACDASNVGIGGVLSQKDESGLERPIAYFSKTLNKAQRKYSTIDKEGIALLHTVRHFHPYLYGAKFTLVTDHNPLTKLKSLRLDSDPHGRRIRMIQQLELYDFDIQYKPGRVNNNADGLSRLPIQCSAVSTIINELSIEKIVQEQRKDEQIDLVSNC